MTVLPGPIPHPLDFRPFDLPRRTQEVLGWVVGPDWPTGDEAATWDLADRWYAVASALAAPHEAAFAAAAQIMTGYGNAGFHDAWQRLAGEPEAPLNSLIEIAHELGGLVDGCGRDVEAAKLEISIEIGLLLNELLETAVTATLTLGAAAPAAGGLLMAARLAIQDIAERLTDRLGAFPDSRTAEASPRPTASPHAAATDRPYPSSAGSAVAAGTDSPNASAAANTTARYPRAAGANSSYASAVGNAVAAVGTGPHVSTGSAAAASSAVGPGATPRSAPRADGIGTRTSQARTITAAGVLQQSYGPAAARSTSGPAAARPVDGGSRSGAEVGAITRRIPRSELERISGAVQAQERSTAPVPQPRAAPTETVAFVPSHRPRETSRPPEQSGYVANAGRAEYAGFLAAVADGTRTRIHELGRLAAEEILTGSPQRGEELRTHSTALRALLAGIEAAQRKNASGLVDPAVVGDPAVVAEPSAHPAAGAAAEPAVGRQQLGAQLAPSGMGSDERSALTGEAGPLPIDRTRRYDTYGGLRAPLAVHQKALEDALPPDGDGRASRLADPRSGRWFGLANGGGPESDPTRGLNCLDAVLALFDTYVHGRPRVAAPRTFDAYAAGNPDRPIGGEWHGLQRIELAAGATFQNLCPFLGGAAPDAARPAVDAAMRNLSNHLHNSGHGAFAFILTDLEGGGCHAWAAVNHDGMILFLDPQLGRLSEEVPLYRHHGVPSTGNVVSMDALVVDGQGRPAPLPYHGPGQWSTASVLVTSS